MSQYAYTHVPVYNTHNHFVGVITEGSIVYRLAQQGKSTLSLGKITVGNILSFCPNTNYLFVSKDKNIYEIDQIVTEKRQTGQRLGAIFITDNGKQQEKILGIITAGDVALVDTFVIH